MTSLPQQPDAPLPAATPARPVKPARFANWLLLVVFLVSLVLIGGGFWVGTTAGEFGNTIVVLQPWVVSAGEWLAFGSWLVVVVTCIVLCVQRKHMAIVLTLVWVPISLIAVMLAICSLNSWIASDRVCDSRGQAYCLLEQFAFFDAALVLAIPQGQSAFHDIYKPVGETWLGNGPIPFNAVPFRPDRFVPSQAQGWLSVAENGAIFGAFGENCYFIYDPKNKTFYSPHDWSNMIRPLETVPERYPRDMDWMQLSDKSTPLADGNGRPSREIGATQPGQKSGKPVN